MGRSRFDEKRSSNTLLKMIRTNSFVEKITRTAVGDKIDLANFILASGKWIITTKCVVRAQGGADGFATVQIRVKQESGTETAEDSSRATAFAGEYATATSIMGINVDVFEFVSVSASKTGNPPDPAQLEDIVISGVKLDRLDLRGP